MEKYLKGDVVIIPFPYSNLHQHKRRPALVLSNLKGRDIILCQITSQLKENPYCVPLEETDFASGKLPLPSNIHCSLVFTMSKDLITKKIGRINMATLIRVLQTFGRLLSLTIPPPEDSS